MYMFWILLLVTTVVVLVTSEFLLPIRAKLSIRSKQNPCNKGNTTPIRSCSRKVVGSNPNAVTHKCVYVADVPRIQYKDYQSLTQLQSGAILRRKSEPCPSEESDWITFCSRSAAFNGYFDRTNRILIKLKLLSGSCSRSWKILDGGGSLMEMKK